MHYRICLTTGKSKCPLTFRDEPRINRAFSFQFFYFSPVSVSMPIDQLDTRTFVAWVLTKRLCRLFFFFTLHSATRGVEDLFENDLFLCAQQDYLETVIHICYWTCWRGRKKGNFILSQSQRDRFTCEAILLSSCLVRDIVTPLTSLILHHG